MALININGTDLDVQEYSFSYKELDLDSGRNLAGVMERNVLEHHVRTIDITFPPMNAIAMRNLINIIDNSTLSISAYNVKTGTMETIICMHGDITPVLNWYYSEQDSLYDAMKVQFVEY